MSLARVSLRVAVSAAVALALGGCFNPFAPRIAADRGLSEPPPVPDSPRNVLRLFEWCWEHQAIAEYRELFTDDFRFAFATIDSAGNPVRPPDFTREAELASATNLFQGGHADQPRANRIVLDFDQNLTAFPDSRPGKTDPWHKEIFTGVRITIETSESTTRIDSRARFFFVRGDSAIIPQELRSRGFGPDPNRWYIERYEEENPHTALAAGAARAGLGARALPVRGEVRTGSPHLRSSGRAQATGSRPVAPGAALSCATWGCVKIAYR